MHPLSAPRGSSIGTMVTDSLANLDWHSARKVYPQTSHLVDLALILV